MKKLFTLLAALALLGNVANAQSYVLDFDGVDDYVDVGTDVGDNIRTVELWFNLSTAIDNNLSEWSNLVYRDGGGNNIETFYLAFAKNTSANPGQLRFWYSTNISTFYTVHSNADNWNADQWHHVAGVIHPQNGMSIYIDGVKQTETDPFSSATATTNGVTAIGRHEFVGGRYFSGRIEDVRFSTDAVYTSNFTPPCPDIPVIANSQAVWNFNEGTGTIATDATVNGFDGTINGATYVMDSICSAIGINENAENTKFTIYPNPSAGKFRVEGLELGVEKVAVYDLFGRMVLSSNTPQIDMRGYAKGMYVARIESNEEIFIQKLILE